MEEQKTLTKEQTEFLKGIMTSPKVKSTKDKDTMLGIIEEFGYKDSPKKKYTNRIYNGMIQKCIEPDKISVECTFNIMEDWIKGYIDYIKETTPHSIESTESRIEEELDDLNELKTLLLDDILEGEEPI